MEFMRQYFVHYYEIGPSRKLSLLALLGYLEDIAILHSEARGMGLDYYESNRCGWMLVKWDVRIRSLPRFGDTVTVHTRINGMKSFFADREFTVTDPDGTVLVEARANWILVDTDKRRPMRIPQEQWDRFGVSPESASRCVTIADVRGSRGAEEGSSEPSVRAFTASNGDIDTNLHVNNLCFIGWALDSLPEDYLFGHEPSRVMVQYRKEVAHGAEGRVETLILPGCGPSEGGPSEGGLSGSRTLHSLYSLDAECCSIEIDWNTL